MARHWLCSVRNPCMRAVARLHCTIICAGVGGLSVVRILHVLGKLDRGGAETWLVQTLRHIDRSKYHFDFLVHADGAGAYDEEVRSLGARIIPCLSPSSPAKFARNFLRILREYGPYDCVHSHVHHYSGYV